MGIYSALSIGNTALLASQKGLEVVGNNIANAATPGYSRQEMIQVPGNSIGSGTDQIGTGVRVERIIRQFDDAVQSRLRHANSDAQSGQILQQTLSQVEALYNETSDTDLSSALTSFFNSMSQLANDPQDQGNRTIAIEQAQNLVNKISQLRGGMDDLRRQINGAVQTGVGEVNRLASDVASLNVQVLTS
jgi:flagellar hook-associated protein 1